MVVCGSLWRHRASPTYSHDCDKLDIKKINLIGLQKALRSSSFDFIITNYTSNFILLLNIFITIFRHKT